MSNDRTNSSTSVIGRRRVLQTLAAGIGSTTLAGCRASETPASTPVTNQSGSGSGGSGGKTVPIHFGGLQLFALQPSKVTVAMPRPESHPTHRSFLVVVGGTAEPMEGGALQSEDVLVGMHVHWAKLTGKRVEIVSDVPSELKVHDEPVNYAEEPQSLAGWQSLRWLLDLRLMYPDKRLKPKEGWDSTLSEAVVAITNGELRALRPNRFFKGKFYLDPPPRAESAHEQYLTGSVAWELHAKERLTVRLTDLTGSSSTETRVLVDATGPHVGFILHLPTADEGSTESHMAEAEDLIEGIEGARRPRPKPRTATPPPSKRSSVRVGAEMSLETWQDLLRIFIDLTPTCPPTTLRLE